METQEFIQVELNMDSTNMIEMLFLTPERSKALIQHMADVVKDSITQADKFNEKQLLPALLKPALTRQEELFIAMSYDDAVDTIQDGMQRVSIDQLMQNLVSALTKSKEEKKESENG